MKEQNAAHSFTPGPWRVETIKEFIKPKTFEIRNYKGLLIADVNIGMGDVEQNANLIASAPDLLAELTRLRSELQQLKEKEVRGDRMIVDLEHQKTVLMSELQQKGELWTKIDGINYPLNTLLIVWNGTYNFAHFNTAYNKWVGLGTETSDTRNLMQFPPTYFMDIPEQPKQS